MAGCWSLFYASLTIAAAKSAERGGHQPVELSISWFLIVLPMLGREARASGSLHGQPLGDFQVGIPRSQPTGGPIMGLRCSLAPYQLAGGSAVSSNGRVLTNVSVS